MDDLTDNRPLLDECVHGDFYDPLMPCSQPNPRTGKRCLDDYDHTGLCEDINGDRWTTV